MFKGKRFKQYSQLNASTSENELTLTYNLVQHSLTNRKRSREDRINRSVCAKRYERTARSKKRSLQHRYNPQQSSTTQKHKEESEFVPCQTKFLIKPKMNNYLNKHFCLKIKQTSFCQEVTPVMRLIMIDWLMQVADDLSLRRQVIHTAIHYLDQMLHKSNITKKELQVHGLCCLMIAQKLESQKILTPFQASELLYREVSQRELIETEERIMKTLEFKLHPVTLWTEMGILLKAFQTYFKDKIDHRWRQYKNKAFWIIDGICLETNYFAKIFPQRQLCLALLFSIVSQYQESLLRYFTGFCRKITGKEFEIEDTRQELKYLQVWLQRKCPCQDQEYSPEHYHAELKKMAALRIHS